ncbi:extracellular solute-binding protein [Pseudokineococcus marinus]|uniref:Extracellular solute-binding protein n=1 Tax=Pseudokineococcus marinus TaxID=351215 RepID=A0A849BGA4_9ACTN|nr:extracellular solute-binding protein [Pseudokineococcus marinus]NNH22120.1 extracellular solute-binding protein [Pseudokineococcus marinus]
MASTRSAAGRSLARAVGLGAAAALALTACAPGSGSDDGGAPPQPTGPVSTDVAGAGDVTLTVWDQEVRGGQDEQITQLNAAFEEAYPNVTVERVSQSFDDLATTLRLALTGEDAPDVVQTNNARATMGQFVAAGQLVPLDAYADAYGWRDRYPESVLQYSTYSEDGTVFGEGSLYGLPQVGEVVGVYYSRSALDELGLEVPQTWSDLEAALQTAADAGRTPLLLGNIEGWPAGHVFGAVQGAHVDPQEIQALGLGNAGASWTTPENLEALGQLQQWQEQGWFNEGVNGTNYDAAWQQLADGQGVFLVAGSWLAPDLQDAMGEDAGFFAPPPADGGELATTGGTGIPFSITTAAEEPDVAAAYIDFLTSDDAMQVLADTGNLPVVDTASYAPESGLLADVYTAFDDVSSQGALLPYLDYATPTFGETLNQTLQGLLAGELTPEQAADALEADYADFTSSGG